MKLEAAESFGYKDVNEEEVIKIFEDDYERGEYVTLSCDKQTFIQAAGQDDDPHVLEYREGGADKYYVCTEMVSKEKVKNAFLKYLRRDNSWKNDFEWKKLEKKPWWKIW